MGARLLPNIFQVAKKSLDECSLCRAELERITLKQYHVVQMPGYWQFQFDDITIDGKKTGTCGCCHVWGLESGAAWQDFPVKSCEKLISHGRLAVSLLKLFQKNLSPGEKYGVGKCQGVLDTGSSLMPHPKDFVWTPFANGGPKQVCML